jgi:predicted Zn-dependent peptidase
MNYTKHILENGLRAVFVPMKDTQTVTVMILVEAGSKYENKKNNGISHFLEHMMFKGTKKRPSSKIITEQLDGVGGDYNAFTGKEQTGYYVKVAAQHFNMALDVVSDLYLNPLLDEKEIEKERGVILQEAAMYRDTPVRYVWDVFEQLLYGDQPAGWDIIGTKKNIKSVKRKDFSDYLSKMYLPQSTVVVVAGNFDEKKALAEIKRIFGKKLSKKERIGKLKTRQSQTRPQLRIHFKKTDQTHLILGVRSCNMFSHDRYATSLLGTVLGGGMSSRMFHNIREKYGLTYYIDAASEQTTDSGYFFARAGVEHKNLKKTIQLILKEFEKVKNKQIPPRELSKAKEYIKGTTLMSLESSSAVASFFGDQELFERKVKKMEDIFKKVDAVTANDLLAVSRKIFSVKGLNLALIGPHQSEKELYKLLKF